MVYKETFWMACDSTEQLRAEYGPFHTRAEAEAEAKKLGFGYLLRYEHLPRQRRRDSGSTLHLHRTPWRRPVGNRSYTAHPSHAMRTCGESAAHEKGWQVVVSGPDLGLPPFSSAAILRRWRIACEGWAV